MRIPKCDIERDARKYAFDHCVAMGYKEEANHCSRIEKQYEKVINGVLVPSAVGLDDEYFRNNPFIIHNVTYNESTPNGSISSIWEAIKGLIYLSIACYSFCLIFKEIF